LFGLEPSLSRPEALRYDDSTRPRAFGPPSMLTNHFKSLPSSMSRAACVGKGTLWADAVARLEEAGFKRGSYAKSHDVDWPDDLDTMAAAPPPKDPQKFRHHALYYHEDGFIVTMSSTQGGFGPGGRDDYQADRQGLNDLNIYMQVDVGTQCLGAWNVSMGSGGTDWQGDGTMLFTGHADVVNGSTGPLGAFLAQSHHNARPIPLKDWQPAFFYVEQQLYSPIPHSSSASKADSIKKRFAERLVADWNSFIASLPPLLAPLVDFDAKAHLPQPRAKLRRRSKLYHHATHANSYFAKQLGALAQNWPSPKDKHIMLGWSDAIENCVEQGELNLPNVHERVAGSSNALHAMASLDSQAAPMACAWISKQDPDDVHTWLGERDAMGRTPAGVAFELALNASEYSFRDKESPSMFDYFMKHGWMGQPGELGQAVHDQLLASKRKMGRRSEHAHGWFGRRQIELIDHLDAQATILSHDWLVPIHAPHTVLTTRLDAMGAILGLIGALDTTMQRHIDAMAIRACALPGGASKARVRL
jgi:hypothetical protein